MTLEQYKKKYSDWIVYPNVCMSIDRSYQEMFPKSDPITNIVWSLDVVDKTVQFGGNVELTIEQITDSVELFKTLLEENERDHIAWEEQVKKSQEDFERQKLIYLIESRKERLQELKEEIEEVKFYLKANQKELKEKEKKDGNKAH